MAKYLLILLLALAPLSALAADTGDVDALLRALAPVEHLQGSFVQRQYGPDGALLAESSGRFRLLRPGYFSWEILSPDEQLVIATPEYVWHYDRDLESVTRRPVTGDAGMTPLQILGGDDAALRENFNVASRGEGTFLLTPKSSGAGFKQLTLTFAHAQITGMEILDDLDQRVVIRFADLDSDSALSSADFAFTPPAGADLFYYDE